MRHVARIVESATNPTACVGALRGTSGVIQHQGDGSKGALARLDTGKSLEQRLKAGSQTAAGLKDRLSKHRLEVRQICEANIRQQ